jgi:lauroyl/myristoyl acyltransferase
MNAVKVKGMAPKYTWKIIVIYKAPNEDMMIQRVIERKIKEGIEVTRRRGRRSRKLLDDLKERRGYYHLKEEALDRTVWRACFGTGFGPVVRQDY